jgi:hypothetical protein
MGWNYNENLMGHPKDGIFLKRLGMINAQLQILFIALMPIIVQGRLSKMGGALVEFVITLVLAGLTAYFVNVLRQRAVWG